MKTIIKSLVMVVAVAAIAGGATYALFSDTETSAGNTFTAGTINLNVDNLDDPNVMHVTLANMKPGDTASYNWTLSNAGSLAGKPWIEITNVVNNDNNCNEPETAAPDATCGNPGPGDGELGDYLMMKLNAPGGAVGYVYPHGPCIDSGSKCTLNYWNSLGNLSMIDGQVWDNIPAASTLAGPMVLEFEILNTTGNIIQSDSVSFDVVFHLDQV